MEVLRASPCSSHQENHCQWPSSCLDFDLSSVFKGMSYFSAVKLMCASSKYRLNKDTKRRKFNCFGISSVVNFFVMDSSSTCITEACDKLLSS